MWTKLTAWWAGLPHQVQAVIVLFGGGALGVLEPVVQNWASGQAVCTATVGLCVRGYLLAAAKAGVAAVIGLYIKSSYGTPKP
jgi:hypothetical protein